LDFDTALGALVEDARLAEEYGNRTNRSERESLRERGKTDGSTIMGIQVGPNYSI
jgi:hypothetical protein